MSSRTDSFIRMLQIRTSAVTVSSIALALVLAACSSSPTADAPTPTPTPTPTQPYAGLQNRSIRALAPERVADLLAGRGAGYALAAELNHYPGPTHVLDMSDQLDLSAEQVGAVSTIKATMQQAAAGFGTQLVDLEERLDRSFRMGEVTPAELALLTSHIADVEGKLRNAHLQAHLGMVEVLSQAQVAMYDSLRGYGTLDEDHTPTTEGHDTHGL